MQVMVDNQDLLMSNVQRFTIRLQLDIFMSGIIIKCECFAFLSNTLQ